MNELNMASSTTSSIGSFMNEILVSAGQLEKEDAGSRLAALIARIEGVRAELVSALQQEHQYLMPSLAAAIDLTQRTRDNLDEMTTLSNRIEKEMRDQLNVSTVEFADLSSQLGESRTVFAMLESLTKIHSALEHTKVSIRNQEYSLATHSLNEVKMALNNATKSERNKDILIYQTLDERYLVLREELVQDLSLNWDNHFSWQLPPQANEYSGAGRRGAELRISSTGDARNTLSKVVQALYSLSALNDHIDQLSTRIMKHIIVPIVTESGVKVDSSTSGGATVLRLMYSKKSSGTPGLTNVFASLTSILTLLHKTVLNIEVNDNVKDEITVSLMNMLGKLMSKQFLALLVEKCLALAIPTNSSQLELFNKTIVMVEVFEKKLKELKFIDENESSLNDYVKNYNIHFANKKCQDILVKAKRLMCSSLHDTIEIESEFPFGKHPILGNGKAVTDSKEAKTAANILTASVDGAKDVCLSASTFHLPVCRISSCIQQVCCLLYEALHEATSSTQQCATQLVFSAHNVLELFCSVVPTFHRDALRNLPQLAALHHNNCFYLAHHMLTLGHQFRARLPPPFDSGLATFVDLVPKIRRLGTECFLQQLSQQKSQMQEYLSSANGFHNVSDENTFLTAEKAVKQSLAQLQHLSNVWNDILPQTIFHKSIGTLLNTLVMDIITSILSLEDISSTDTHGLVSLISIVQDKAVDLFPQNEESEQGSLMLVMRNVARWNRLSELRLVLDAGLRDIAERWADGKGALAAEFSANEVKQLIRALFQNTDRRAAILARIR